MLRLVETFSGLGSQAKALKNIGIDFEVVKTAEWDITAIIAYCLIHKGKIDIHPYDDVEEEKINLELSKYTLSIDGKSPIKESSLKRLPIYLKKVILAAIKETNNLVNIQDVKGKDIPDNIDLLTYSFPCQDLSACAFWHGNKSGISREANNRSGMLWEIERILIEMNANNQKLPRFLLMENVTNILSRQNRENFNEWKSVLESLGYYNQVYSLKASDFGIPQKRKRTYMISVLCESNNCNLVKKFFEEHNLENNLEEVKRLKRRDIFLEDILKLDYEIDSYRLEANNNRPNNTSSRRKIYLDNDLLFDGKKINNINVKTLTTKQDRNPNSGLIEMNDCVEGKANFRYLTPRECFLLMGFDEKDYQILIENNFHLTKSRKIFSNGKLIKLAGNSIVVDVLEVIFKQILELDELIKK